MHVVWDGKTDLLFRNVKDHYKKYTSSRVAAALPYLGKRTEMLARCRTLEKFERAVQL